uniref:Uncharacterized protein n=1 Tax=Solanum lycopersicum TaxID=4081 RepID=A0A3Q7GHS0_SOLLC
MESLRKISPYSMKGKVLTGSDNGSELQEVVCISTTCVEVEGRENEQQSLVVSRLQHGRALDIIVQPCINKCTAACCNCNIEVNPPDCVQCCYEPAPPSQL